MRQMVYNGNSFCYYLYVIRSLQPFRPQGPSSHRVSHHDEPNSRRAPESQPRSQHSHLINVGPRWYKFDWKANPDWSELGQWLRKWLVEEGVAELDAVEFTNRLQEAREDEAEGL